MKVGFFLHWPASPTTFTCDIYACVCKSTLTPLHFPPSYLYGGPHPERPIRHHLILRSDLVILASVTHVGPPAAQDWWVGGIPTGLPRQKCAVRYRCQIVQMAKTALSAVPLYHQASAILDLTLGPTNVQRPPVLDNHPGFKRRAQQRDVAHRPKNFRDVASG